MLPRQYTVVDNGSFIEFVGVAGTLAEGLTFSLQKQNIVKITEKTAGNTVAFLLTSGDNLGYSASDLIDPATGLPFVDAATAATYFLSIGTVAGGGSAITADGDTMYSNISGDFTATVVDGTKDIEITFATFSFDETSIVSLQLINSIPELVTLPISGCTVALDVITVSNASNDFALGDKVIVTLQGPKKAYNKIYDATKTLTQNPEYAHTTVPQVLADAVTTELVVRLTAQNAIAGPTFENDGSVTPFGEYNISIGSEAYNITQGLSIPVPDGITAVIANTSISGDLGGGGGNWDPGDEAIFSGVRRWIVSMDTYKYFTLHYRLASNTADDLLVMKVYGTNDVNADIASRDGWVDMSNFFLGVADIQVTNLVVEDIVMPTFPATIEKIMIELIGYTTSVVPQDIEYTLIVKKA